MDWGCFCGFYWVFLVLGMVPLGIYILGALVIIAIALIVLVAKKK